MVVLKKQTQPRKLIFISDLYSKDKFV